MSGVFFQLFHMFNVALLVKPEAVLQSFDVQSRKSLETKLKLAFVDFSMKSSSPATYVSANKVSISFLADHVRA